MNKLSDWLQVIGNFGIVIGLALVLPDAGRSSGPRSAGQFSLESGFMPVEVHQEIQARIDDSQDLNPLSDYEFIIARLREEAPIAEVDLSGAWEIHSSVGGATPIVVRCDLVQQGSVLSGSCTPEMADATASALSGTADGSVTIWGYEVVFNGQPGTVEFRADTVTADGMLGTLSLSGTEAPFSALKR